MKSKIGGKIQQLGEGWRRFAAAVGTFVLWVWAFQVLAAGAPPASKIINVADSRALAPGLAKWIADIYNSSYWLYGVVVVATMVGMGLILGFGFDRVVGLLGIDLGKLEHHE